MASLLVLAGCERDVHAGHPNIVEFMGMFQDETHIHIVQELCSGGDLYRYVDFSGHAALRLTSM